ncbi:MAG: hypothetical protein H6R19_2942 [Proteobacteria bacterium]|nr:hypothetical protein [Pseudomonadota bacterium]
MSAAAILETYKPSGKVNLGRLTWRTAFIALPLLAVFAWGYALVMRMNPPWWFALLAVLIFAACVACTVAAVLKAGHSRSVAVNTGLAVLLAAVAVWLRWLVTFRGMGVEAALVFAHAGLIDNLGMLWQLATTQAANNAREFSPVWRCFFWLLELVFISGLTVGVARDEARKPYSEAAQHWAEKEAGGELYWEDGRSPELEAHLAAQGPAALCAMLRASALQIGAVASEWWTVGVSGWKVEADERARWLEIEIVVQRRDEDGKVKTRRRTLVSAWQVSEDAYAQVFAYLGATHVHEVSSAGGDGSARPTPTELQAAVAALQAENHASAIALANAQIQHPDVAVRADALRVCALAHSGMAQWPQAFDAFHGLFELEPTAHNALQLATTSVMSGELTRGQAWFDKAEQINAETQEMPQPRLRTAYMSALKKVGETAALMPHLNWLAAAYKAVSITDPHFLYMRGLPFFNVFLDKASPTLRACLPEAELKAWYEDLADSLDEDGREAVARHLVAQGLTA